MSEFQKVAKLDDVHDGQITLAKIGKEQIALYRLGNEVLATTNICTHEYCELDQNHNIEGEEVECTCHGSKFKIRTGENTSPPAAEPLPIFKTKVENGEVFVEI
ncbi:MAG: non-heme iron oxygenase ferredoxin subunit [bacterium]|nr:non-heme iron oxygenase ferredoxin subunit [bacterium]